MNNPPHTSRKPADFIVGAMNFGGRTPEGEAVRIVERALERGVLDFDTANAYQDGESERILGGALRQHPGARIATKAGLLRVAGKPEGLAPERVLESARASRDRLGRPHIDLLYLHAPDSSVPVEETLSAVAALLAEGTIRSFGVSNYSSWQILEIIHLCRARSLPLPSVSQVLYNVVVRQVEIEYLAFAKRYALRTAVYNPLAGGLLTARYADGTSNDELPKGSRLESNRIYRRRYGSPRFRELARGLAGIAAEQSLSLMELAYVWLLRRPGVDSLLIGPATVEHLDAALGTRDKILSTEALAKIAALQLAFDGTDAVYAR